MNSFGDVMRNLDWSVPMEILMSIIPALVCITLHELSHGYVAYKLGDIFGLVMMVAFKFGWAKPVPVDMRNFKHPKRDMAITALAGPVSNVLICCIVLFIYGLIFLPCKLSGSSFLDSVLNMVYITAYLSIALAIFNIIPIPPLDGSKVLFSLMSDESYYKLMRYEHYGMIILLVLIASDVLGAPLQMVTQAVFKFLFAFAEWGFSLSRILFY